MPGFRDLLQAMEKPNYWGSTTTLAHNACTADIDAEKQGKEDTLPAEKPTQKARKPQAIAWGEGATNTLSLATPILPRHYVSYDQALVQPRISLKIAEPRQRPLPLALEKALASGKIPRQTSAAVPSTSRTDQGGISARSSLFRQTYKQPSFAGRGKSSSQIKPASTTLVTKPCVRFKADEIHSSPAQAGRYPINWNPTTYRAVLRDSADWGDFANFAALPYVCVPTSGRNRHCGAHAVAHVLNAAPSFAEKGPTTREDVARLVIIQSSDLALFTTSEPLSGDEDLRDLPNRNFTVDQLAGALAGFGNYALGVLQLSRQRNLVYVVDERDGESRTFPPEVLWVMNTDGIHWEALVPWSRRAALGIGRRRYRGVRVELVEDGVKGGATDDKARREATSTDGLYVDDAYVDDGDVHRDSDGLYAVSEGGDGSYADLDGCDGDNNDVGEKEQGILSRYSRRLM